MGPTRPLNPALRPKSKGAAVKRPAENYERIRGWEQQRTSLYRWSGSGGCGSSWGSLLKVRLAPGNTVDGSGGPVHIGNGSRTFVSDGVSNWFAISKAR